MTDCCLAGDLTMDHCRLVVVAMATLLALSLTRKDLGRPSEVVISDYHQLLKRNLPRRVLRP